MRRSFYRIFQTLFAAIAVAGVLHSPALAAEKKDFKVAWSIYVGWMPWGYAADSGIVKKWADKYGINIEVKQFNDYVESINQYTAGAFDAVQMWVATMADPAEFGPAWIGLVLFGALLTVAYRRSRTLWLPIGIHAAGIWVLQSYGAFSTRLGTPGWAGTKLLYDGVPGWIVLLLATLWLARRKSVPPPRADARP